MTHWFFGEKKSDSQTKTSVYVFEMQKKVEALEMPFTSSHELIGVTLGIHHVC